MTAPKAIAFFLFSLILVFNNLISWFAKIYRFAVPGTASISLFLPEEKREKFFTVIALVVCFACMAMGVISHAKGMYKAAAGLLITAMLPACVDPLMAW